MGIMALDIPDRARFQWVPSNFGTEAFYGRSEISVREVA